MWRGALLLGDLILHQTARFSGTTVLELGSGPGLTGLLAAQFARLVFLTGTPCLARAVARLLPLALLLVLPLACP